jgi:sulfonate transport system permease protein
MSVQVEQSAAALDEAGSERSRAKRLADDRKRWRALQTLAIRFVSVIAVLALWQFVGSGIDPVLFTTPLAVAKAAYAMIVSGELWNYLWPSLIIFAVGLTIAALVGIATGLLLARFWVLDVALGVYITFLYSIPAVALVPLIVLWAGFESTAKIIVLFLFAFFPMAINTYQGVKNVDPRLIEVGRSFRCSERQLWANIVPSRRAAVHRHRPAPRGGARADRHGAGRSIHGDFRHRLSDRAHRRDLSG